MGDCQIDILTAIGFPGDMSRPWSVQRTQESSRTQEGRNRPVVSSISSRSRFVYRGDYHYYILLLILSLLLLLLLLYNHARHICIRCPSSGHINFLLLS